MWEHSNGNIRIWKPVAIEGLSYVGPRVGKEQKREVCGCRSVGDLRAQPREEVFEQHGKCRHQRCGVASSNAQGQTMILLFHVCIRPWKLHPSGKWLNENSLTSLSLQVVFIALFPCSFSKIHGPPNNLEVVGKWNGLGLMQIWGLGWNTRQDDAILILCKKTVGDLKQ